MLLIRYQPVQILAIILYNYYITHLEGRHPERNKDKVSTGIAITIIFIDFILFSCSKVYVQEQYHIMKVIILILTSIYISAAFATSPEEVSDYKKMAESGDAFAQLNLGLAYATGDGAPRDHSKAMFWWMKSANRGNTRAQFNIGLAYAKGDGVKKNFAEAIRWFRRSLQKDEMHQDKSDRFYEYLMRLAESGDPNAQNKIGYAFENGLWFPKNEAEASKWYLKAAEQNNLEAECSLGFVYLLGIGTEVNPSEAIKWWTKSAMQGDWLAQLSLGLLYSEGVGVKKNDAEAYAYLGLSASSNEDAARMLAVLETQISSETLSMGRIRLAEIQKLIETKNKK